MTNYSQYRPRWRRATSLFATLGLVLSLNLHAQADQSTADPRDPATGFGDLDSASVIIYLSSDGVVFVTADGVFDLDQYSYNFDFAGHGEFVLWFIMAEHTDPATVFVSRDGVWTETLWLDSASFGYVIRHSDVSSYAFEIASAGQEVPTKPKLVLVPIKDPPSPL